ncbi:glutathione S-transferase U17-like [Bidens hawaiensis]|uniref:glutathione S-transferase U17-like n=1 Tax=Bidens hawaiensis TaxID=980011 RepID=UPI00404994D1
MAKESEIKLLGTIASSYVNRVQFALNLKSINYEYIEEDLANKSKLLFTSNPVYKRVPVLIHGDKSICESQVILEYLDDIQPDSHPLLPPAPLDRANCRFWASYIDTKFFPLYDEMRRTRRQAGKEAIKEQMIEATRLLEEALIKSSNGKAYFGGDEIGFLDVMLGSCIRWMKFIDDLNDFDTFDEVRVPELGKWAKNISSHEALKSATPDKETLDVFFAGANAHRPPYDD